MAASIALLNRILDYGISGISAASGIYVGLYSGGAAPTDGGYVQKLISTFDASSGGVKAASVRVHFSPTGAAAGGWGYDEVRIVAPMSGVTLHSRTISPPQFINNLDAHQILISFSGA